MAGLGAREGAGREGGGGAGGQSEVGVDLVVLVATSLMGRPRNREGREGRRGGGGGTGEGGRTGEGGGTGEGGVEHSGCGEGCTGGDSWMGRPGSRNGREAVGGKL